MSDDTVGFVATETKDETKDFFAAMDAVQQAVEETGYNVDNVRYVPESRYAMVYISIWTRQPDKAIIERSSHRMVHVFFDCDGDHNDIHVGSKIIWSMGVHKDGPMLVLAIAEKMSIFGAAYYCSDDSGDNWKWINNN